MSRQCSPFHIAPSGNLHKAILRIKPLSDSTGDAVSVSRFIPWQGALPHNADPPAFGKKNVSSAMIAIKVDLELCLPELLIRFRHGCISAGMPMPEAAMDEHYSMPTRKGNIWPPFNA